MDVCGAEMKLERGTGFEPATSCLEGRRLAAISRVQMGIPLRPRCLRAGAGSSPCRCSSSPAARSGGQALGPKQLLSTGNSSDKRPLCMAAPSPLEIAIRHEKRDRTVTRRPLWRRGR